MKVQNILLGRSVRLLKFDQPMGGIHLKRAVDALQERYSFMRVPQTLEEYNEAQGIHFKHGRFLVDRDGTKREIVIDDFAVYSDGVVADTRSHTEEADDFLSDLINWGAEYFQMKYNLSQPMATYYISNLEIVLEAHLSEFVAPSTSIVQQLTACFDRYGLKVGPFEVTSLVFDFDRKVMPSVSSNYTLQRREGVPFELNTYFSSAPLKTDDHIDLLQSLEASAIPK